MQDTWQTFLRHQKATVQDDGAIKFDDKNIHSTKTSTTYPIVSPLADFALLAVSGNDRHVFLHDQFINDLNLIKKPAAQLSAWCNAKGQVITNFIIINTDISYLLIFKQELKEFVQKRLSMFVMRSDVTIKNISKSSPLIGLANIKNLAALDVDIPKTPGGVHAVDDLIIICHPDNSNRYLITGSIETLMKKFHELNIKLSSSSVWELLDILAGLPWITSSTQEQFLPQMLNLDSLKALSYQKGCYPGQEVIARLHYRSEAKKRLQLIKSKSKLNIGSHIYLRQSGNKVGEIINSSTPSGGEYYGLAVIELNKINKKLVSDNEKISIIDLPYSVDS